MKVLLFNLITLLLLATTQGQPNGYYVNIEGDTVTAHISIPQDFPTIDHLEKLFRKVSIQRCGGVIATYKPGDISAFSFDHKKKRYHFELQTRGRYHLFVNTLKDSVPAFMLILNKGSHAACYLYYQAGSEDNNTADYYTLTRSIDSKKLLLHNFGKLPVLRRNIGNFYAHLPASKKAMKGKFKRYYKLQKDLIKFMEAINR